MESMCVKVDVMCEVQSQVFIVCCGCYLLAVQNVHVPYAVSFIYGDNADSGRLLINRRKKVDQVWCL